MSQEEICISCRKPRARLKCEICQEPVCKDCEQFLEESTFSFMKKVPEELRHTHYCSFCHDEKVAPALEKYQETMERARGLYIFFTTQRKAVPALKKSKEVIRVDSCEDRDETILRLAFLAAEQGYNAVMEVEVVSEKVRNEGYQKSRWRGVGVPVNVDAEKMERSFY